MATPANRSSASNPDAGSGSQNNFSAEENVLLVVATLIATVTFQAGVNPPGGIWQESGEGDAGKAIFASQPGAFYVFLFSNTIGLSTSIVVINSLIRKRIKGFQGFPFFAIGTATVAMLVTYASAIFAVTPRDSVRFRNVLFVGTFPFIVWGLFSLFRKPKSGSVGDQNQNR